MSDKFIGKYQEELEFEILQMLKEGRPELNLEGSSNFVEDGIIDSFEIVMLTTEFEKKFGVSIPGEDIIPEVFSTVASMANLVRRLKSKE